MSDEASRKTGRAKSSKKATSNKNAGQKKGEVAAVRTGPERLYDFADELDAGEARPERSDEVQEDLQTWVTFTLGGACFALPVTATQEILRVSSVTRVPHAPYSVRGIINMRGRSVPVIDFRLRLGLGENEINASSRILITETRQRFLGLLVSSVEHVLQLDRNRIEPAPADVMTDQSDYIIGVYHQDDTLLILLDVEEVLLIPDSLEAANSGR